MNSRKRKAIIIVTAILCSLILTFLAMTAVYTIQNTPEDTTIVQELGTEHRVYPTKTIQIVDTQNGRVISVQNLNRDTTPEEKALIRQAQEDSENN